MGMEACLIAGMFQAILRHTVEKPVLAMGSGYVRLHIWLRYVTSEIGCRR